jgi:hypothetical protein
MDGTVVRFKRDGGFIPIPLSVEIDTASLPATEARQVEQLVEEANFFKLPATSMPRRGADRFEYSITVEKGDKRHTVRTADGAVPEDLQPLLDYLTQVAARRNR